MTEPVPTEREMEQRAERAEAVVDAAKAWRTAQNEMFTDVDWSARVHNELVAAVDALHTDKESQ